MLNSVVGQVARGDKYFDRPYLTKILWEKISSGNNVLISAPRRVGKTSLMYHLFDNPIPSYRVVYIITESIHDDSEFFKRLFEEIANELHGAAKHTHKIKSFMKKFGSRFETIGKEIKLGDEKMNYYDEFIDLLKEIDLESDKLLIMIDEFAQTTENIYKKHNLDIAVQFLEKNRVLRHDPKIIDKVKFLYAGSISLQAIVDNMDSSYTTNDLYSFDFKPFSKEESNELIKMLLNGTGYKISKPVINYLLEKIEWLIPFYIQILIDEAYKICVIVDSKTITKEIIDEALTVTINNKNYFQHWFTRLRKVLKDKDFKFAKDLLNKLSDTENIETKEIINLAEKNELGDSYRNILFVLKYDGYINNNNDAKIYKFNSPILKLWWNKNVAN